MGGDKVFLADDAEEVFDVAEQIVEGQALAGATLLRSHRKRPESHSRRIGIPAEYWSAPRSAKS